MKKIPRTKHVRILFEDESRFGRINDERRCWSPLHFRPEVGTQIIREFVYAVAAVDPFTGSLSSLILPWSDAETMSIFLAHTSSQFMESFNIMFLDCAGWHTANALRVPENIKIVFLPPYSLELNPMEGIWKHLRGNFFGNRVFESLDEVEETLCHGLRYLNRSQELVRSITCYDWINTISLTAN